MSTIIGIIFLIVVVSIMFLRWMYNHSTVKGHVGELLVAKRLNQLPEEYKVLNNIVLPTNRGTTQIDHVVVSRYGIFVIETKNYKGAIYGNDNTKAWKQTIKTDVRYRRKWYKAYTYITTNKFYNPVKQSLGHTIAIKNALNDLHIPIVSVVVFLNQASLENVKTQYNVVNLRNLLPVILDYRLAYVSHDDVENIVTKLQELNVRNVVSNKKHVKNIQRAKKEREDYLKQGVCPICEGALVIREGTYGKFVGCSNYPKCKFKCSTKEIPFAERLKLTTKEIS